MGSSSTADALRAVLRRFGGRRVTVVGDSVLDCYLYGTTSRISREAPVLIVREDAREHRLGGAANTARNLATLGAEVSLVGLIGDDTEGSRLTEIATQAGIDTRFLLRTGGACTVTKTRVLAGGLNTRKQQMIRIDREIQGTTSTPDRQRLERAVRDAIDPANAIIISEYGDGSLTPTYVHAASEAIRAGKIVVVDSRHALSSYSKVTAVTPNEPEAEEALGVRLASVEDALRAAERLQHELEVEAAILTRGREGMIVAERGREPVILHAHGGHEAVDVTGAGDTVAAAFTLALTAGASTREAAMLANCAASIVVRSIGATACSPGELRESLDALDG